MNNQTVSTGANFNPLHYPDAQTSQKLVSDLINAFDVETWHSLTWQMFTGYLSSDRFGDTLDQRNEKVDAYEALRNFFNEIKAEQDKLI